MSDFARLLVFLYLFLVTYCVSAEEKAEFRKRELGVNSGARTTGGKGRYAPNAPAQSIRGIEMPAKAQVSLEETLNVLDLIEARRAALKNAGESRDVNLLVFGLGYDSPFWRKTTTGTVLFLEQFDTPWFPKPCPDDVLAVSYKSSMLESKICDQR